MSDKTGIEWTDATWNPTTGCDRVSPGCDHCYAMTLAPRLKAMGSPRYQRDGDPRTSGPGFGVTEHPTALDQPLRWKRGRRIFVNSMSDLFHDEISDDFIAQVFAVMALAPQHTFQVLTKRHGRMRSLLTDWEFVREVGQHIVTAEVHEGREFDLPEWGDWWPLPNVWLGVSVETQQWADIRIPALLATPAAVRFLSCEPLLGPVSLFANTRIDTGTLVDWLIVGGESGRGARPMRRAWATGLRDECRAHGIAFHFKQWCEWAPTNILDPRAEYPVFPDTTARLAYAKVGKKSAGRELDGRTWDEFPAVAS